MAKKGLAALASKQINSTIQPSATAPVDAPHETAAPEQATVANEVPATVEKPKRGRPKKGTNENCTPITVNIPDDLLQELKIAAVQMRTTQKFIIIDALIDWLDK